MNYNTTTYIVLYCFIFLSCGSFFGILGPFIPYLASENSVNQTQYSFIFVTRTFGSITSILLYKTLQKYKKLPPYHVTVSLSALVIFIGHILLAKWNSFFGSGISIIIISLGYSFITTVISVCLVIISKQKSGQIIPFVHAIFGIGALTSPLILRHLQLNTPVFTSFMFLATAIFSYILPSPVSQQAKTDFKAVQLGKVSLKIEIMLCIGLFLLVGTEVTFTGWISTYAVLSLGEQKKTAAIYVTFFWIASTICRLMTSFSSLVSSVKLRYLSICLFAAGFISFIMNKNQFHQELCYISAILFGVGTSGIYALLMAISSQFKLKLRPDQTSMMAAAASISTGILTALTGRIMRENVNNLFLSLLVITGSLSLTCYKLIQQFRSLKPSQQGVQLNEHLTKN